MKTKEMVMKRLAIATTLWSAEMAMVMEVAVYATSMTVSMKMKKASTETRSPATQHPRGTPVRRARAGQRRG